MKVVTNMRLVRGKDASNSTLPALGLQVKMADTRELAGSQEGYYVLERPMVIDMNSESEWLWVTKEGIRSGKKCKICDKPMTIDEDCGGDCLECMATIAEDPECIERWRRMEDERRKD